MLPTRFNLSGTGDLVITDLRRTTARLELTQEVSGRISVRNQRGDLEAELFKPSGADRVILALEPGRYKVTVDDEGRLWRADKRVSDASHAVLTPADLRPVSREAATPRGNAKDIPEPPERDKETKKSKYVRRPFNFGFVEPLSVNRGGKDIRNNVSMSVLHSRAARVEGAALSFGVNQTTEGFTGGQIGLIANMSKGRSEGGQVSTFFNTAGDLHGVQFSQGVNVAGNIRGSQLALVNRARGVRGAQLSLVNSAQAVGGAQIGLVNVAGRSRGVQLGLINVAGSAESQVGLFSVNREGNVHPEIWTSDTSMFSFGLRFPAKRTYGFLMAGLHPSQPGDSWQFGAGFGGRVKLPASLYLEMDISGYMVFGGLDFSNGRGGLSKFRMMLAWQARPRLTVFGGPTFNVFIDEFDDDDGTPRPGYPYAFNAYTRNKGSDPRVRVWPGFALGVRF